MGLRSGFFYIFNLLNIKQVLSFFDFWAFFNFNTVLIGVEFNFQEQRITQSLLKRERPVPTVIHTS